MSSSTQAEHCMALYNTDREPIWLDLLPVDVCVRIILHLHPASLHGALPECRSLLSLAESSNVQRLATLSALSYRFLVPKQANYDFWSRWAAVFGGEVRELSLLSITAGIDTLFKATNLHKAEIINARPMLDSLSNACHLRHLELNLIRYSNTSALENIRALQNLKLETLGLFCDVHSVAACIFTEQSHLIAISDICQELQFLKVSCFCGHRTHPIWHFLQRLPLLRQVAVDGRSLQNMNDSDLTLLQNIRSVTLDGGAISVETALRVGTSVRIFRSSLVLENKQLEAMRGCCRLVELQICLTPTACRILPELTRALRRLVILHVRAVPKGRVTDVGSGTIYKAVTNAAELHTLRLTAIRVNTRELVAVLKHLGTRLTEFESTVDEMDPSQVGQIEALLETAANFNTKLRKFDLVSTISAGKRPCHWPSVSRQASLIRRRYERLRLRAPGLYSWSLGSYIYLLEHDAWHSAK